MPLKKGLRHVPQGSSIVGLYRWPTGRRFEEMLRDNFTRLKPVLATFDGAVEWQVSAFGPNENCRPGPGNVCCWGRPDVRRTSRTDAPDPKTYIGTSSSITLSPAECLLRVVGRARLFESDDDALERYTVT